MTSAEQMLADEARQGRIAVRARSILEDLILSTDLSGEDADAALDNLQIQALRMAEKELTPAE
jgi:hypothetical protein